MVQKEGAEEIITKEFIDNEIAEKAFVDDRILAILENIELVLIVLLVCFMIYITYKRIVVFWKKKKKEQQDLFEEHQRNLLRDFKEKDNDNDN